MITIDRTEFDVIVLGTGIAGTMMSAILARNGHSVLMIDSGVHPRFAIGESTIPQTSQLISMLAKDFNVPEFQHIGLDSPDALRLHVTRNCGIKRIFGFAYHRLGEEHQIAEAHQFGNIWRDENHLFRQDVDAYLLTVALHYGARAAQSTQVESIDIDERGVRVTAGGKTYRSRFVVDGTGFRSVLADKYGLREQPCGMVSSTRSIFTHVINVRPFEEIVGKLLTQPWATGTLHHVFKRGWFWVIPFNNWEGAPNPLVSVGVTVDDRVWPEDASLTPEQEFQSFLRLLPSVERQFADAKAVRPWVRTKRIQYSSRHTVGYRYALLSHAAGFIDPLFSRGLINTVENLHSLARALLDALSADDFAETRFENVEVEAKRGFSFADRLVAAAYASWDDFEMWNAWLRVWAIHVHAAESRLGGLLTLGGLSPVRMRPLANPIASNYEEPGFRPFFEAMYGVMERYEAKQLSIEQARAELWGILSCHEFSIPLRDGSRDHEWAMAQPRVRDFPLGMPEKHARWKARLTDF
jgi:tetracycline 7-halogenase / FADH2 O2-dependent halogenase